MIIIGHGWLIKARQVVAYYQTWESMLVGKVTNMIMFWKSSEGVSPNNDQSMKLWFCIVCGFCNKPINHIKSRKESGHKIHNGCKLW